MLRSLNTPCPVATRLCWRRTPVGGACPRLIPSERPCTRRPTLRSNLHCKAIASGSREDVDKITVDQLDLEDPFSHVCGGGMIFDNHYWWLLTLVHHAQVEDVMRDFELKFASPNQLLTQVQPLLDAVTGLPVVDDSLVVVGVLSRKVCCGCGGVST